MSFPLLASLGVRLDKENLYTNLLAAVKEKNLGRDVITNQFVSEISDAMGKRAQGHSVQSSGLMTAKQACHILALIVDQVKFPSEDSITKQIRTQLWHKRDLDKLKGMLKEGLVQPGNPWPILEKVFPSAGPAGEKDAVKAKIPRLDKHLPFMSAAGFQGSCVEEVVKWLESWQPDNEQLQNDLIDEFIGNFDTPAHSCYTEKYKIFILATGCIKFSAIPLVLVYYSFLDVHGVKTVYLCICVFSCETLANIDSDILVTLAFQKYSICHAHLHFPSKLY